MSDQQSQQGDHPQDNQPELQQHNGEVVPPPHILAIVEAIDVLGDLIYDIRIILVDRLRMKRHHTPTLSRAEREAAIKDFITLARYLKNIPFLNGVAGENSTPPNLEDFIPGKCLPVVIDVYVNNDFLYLAFGSRDFSDQSTTRRAIKFVRQYPQRTVIDEGMFNTSLWWFHRRMLCGMIR